MTNKELLNIFETTANKKPFTLSEGTIKDYLYYLENLISFLNNKSLIDITKNDIKLYMLSLDVSDSYYNGKLSAFRTFYKIMSYHPSTEDLFQIDQTMGIMKVRNVQNKKEQIFLTSEQQSAMINSAKNIRDKAILKLYLNTGLRVHELIALTIEQYNNKVYNKIDLVVTKGSHNRPIWLSNDTIETIDEYLKTRKECEFNNLFISNGRKPMDRSCISKTLKTIAKRCGMFSDEEIERISNHTMRRSLATTLLNEKDIPIDIVAKALGHSNLASVMRYAKTNEERVKEIMLTN